MNALITIRPATELSAELIDVFSRLVPHLSTAAPVDIELLQRLLAHEATTLLTARIEDRLVGLLTLVIYHLPTGLRAHIDDVVVDDSTRGPGVGAALVETALTTAKREGVRTIDLTSRPDREAAIRLSTKLGFARRDSHIYPYQPPQPD